MKNLILLITLFIGLFSFAQNNGTGSSLEVIDFTHGGVSYKHVQGSLYPGENCFDNVQRGTTSVLSLNDNDLTGAELILTLSVDGINYQFLASENAARIAEWGEYAHDDRTFLASDESEITEDLLLCIATWTETNVGSREYTNTDFPRYAIVIGENTNNWIPRLQLDGVNIPGYARFVAKDGDNVDDALTEGISLFDAHMASIVSTQNFISGPTGSYRVLEVGVWFYVEVTDASGNVSHLEPFLSRSDADAFGVTATAATTSTPSIGVCSSDGISPVGFSLEQYISSTITENGVSRFDYHSQNVAYEYRDIYRLNPWNRFDIYPPVITIASNQIKVISHRTALEIQPSDVRITLDMNGDCSILDIYITEVVNAYRTAFDANPGAYSRPEIVISGWTGDSEAFPSTYTHPDYDGASYLIDRESSNSNRTYRISNVIGVDGTQLTVLGHTLTGNAQIQLETAYYTSINDAHAAARLAIESQD